MADVTRGKTMRLVPSAVALGSEQSLTLLWRAARKYTHTVTHTTAYIYKQG